MLPLLPHSIRYVGGNSTLTHLTTGAIPRARKERTAAVISEHSQLTTSAPENSSIIDVRKFLRTERVIIPFWPEATCSNSSPCGCGEHRLAPTANRTTISRSSSPQTSHYTDWATPDATTRSVPHLRGKKGQSSSCPRRHCDRMQAEWRHSFTHSKPPR